MNPFKLVAKEGKQNMNINPSIQVLTNSGNHQIATVWADGIISFERDVDYTTDEVSSITAIAKNFFSIYNTVVELQKEVELLRLQNPVLEINSKP